MASSVEANIVTMAGRRLTIMTAVSSGTSISQREMWKRPARASRKVSNWVRSPVSCNSPATMKRRSATTIDGMVVSII